MNKNYKTLFGLIAQTLETTAEKAMEFDKKSSDMQAYKTAKEMRAKYARLHDLLTSDKVNYILTKADYIDLFIGANLVVQQIKNKIQKEQLALEGYETDLIPKLKQMIEAEEEISEELAEKLFTVLDDSNN